MTQLNDLMNAWQGNIEVFRKQLRLNQFELSDSYPQHWHDLLAILAETKTQTLLDVGCGCGAVFELCRRHFPDIKYFGIDSAKEAIDLAIETWGDVGNFRTKDYREIEEHEVELYDTWHLGAILDVLPNADDALDDFLNLGPKNIIIGRMKFTDNVSHYSTYVAYEEITTCEYYHNSKNFLRLCDIYRYDVYNCNDSFLLRKRR